jgi:uncharacterized protein YdiU (UPF0061 family)
VTTTTTAPLPLARPAFADLEGLFVPWEAARVPEPGLVVLNDGLADELGLDPDALRSPRGIAALLGQEVPEGTMTLAQAYAGHQFGSLSPALGDGRALLLGELTHRDGRPRDVHLKGSGATPFSRGGDGRAALGPMLREHLVGEAMHALGIPTTRALAVLTTGQQVVRDGVLPGAVLVRVASSHLRVGTFWYAALHGGPELVRRVADHAIERHHPAAADAEQPYVALFEAVVEAQAALVARWMLVGFIHGVMNTDNMTISGETIDYGPCAFMDRYDPTTVFSSIDHGGRYAYGNQPRIAHWNLARLGEAMLPLFGEEVEPAVEAANGVLATYADRYEQHWFAGMRAKLGLTRQEPTDRALVEELLELLLAHRADMTSTFRALAAVARSGDDHHPAWARAVDAAAFASWVARWRSRVGAEGRAPEEVAAAMDRVNPVHIPRNHLVEEALDAAVDGDRGPYDALLAAVTSPFTARPGEDRYAEPGPDGVPYRTFCGT